MNIFKYIQGIFQILFAKKPEAPPKEPSPIIPQEGTTQLGSIEYYQKLWKSAVLSETKEESSRVAWCIKMIMQHKDRYLFVQRQTGTPWQLIAAIHGLEASFNFKTCLHNGDPLGQKTTHVPKGRGPFFTWEDAAIDALNYDGLITPEPWSVAKCLKMAERFNGLGYLKYHPDVKSPYIWSCTNIYKGRGKYTYDSKFDPNAKDDQVGVAAVFLKLKALGELDMAE